MSTKDLIDISTRPDFKEITARGGRVKSKAKTMAAKLRGIKRTSPAKLETRAMKMVSDPDFSALQIIEVIDSLLQKDLSERLRMELIGKMTQAHTAIHGQKTKNLNLNIDLTSNKVIERLKNWKKTQIAVIDK